MDREGVERSEAVQFGSVGWELNHDVCGDWSVDMHIRVRKMMFDLGQTNLPSYDHILLQSYSLILSVIEA